MPETVHPNCPRFERIVFAFAFAGREATQEVAELSCNSKDNEDQHSICLVYVCLISQFHLFHRILTESQMTHLETPNLDDPHLTRGA